MSVLTHRHPSARRRWARSGVVLAVAAVLSGSGLHAVAATSGTSIDTTALILADTDRDGVLTAEDAEGSGTWTKDRGALFLANLDDDTSRCPKIASDGTQLTDVQLAACNDAADGIVNGDSDVLDLARVQVQPVDTAKVSSVRV